jgi:hypothetical protein
LKHPVQQCPVLGQGKVMEEQIFCDGIGRIAIIGGVVRLDLFTYSPTETDANGNPRPVLSHRIVMGTEGFLHSSEKVVEAVQVIQRARQGAPQPRPQGAPPQQQQRPQAQPPAPPAQPQWPPQTAAQNAPPPPAPPPAAAAPAPQPAAAPKASEPPPPPRPPFP